MHIKLLTAAVAATLGAAAPAHAEFALGDETRGATVKVGDETDLKVRVRLQPRLDIGDLLKDTASGQYISETDLYVRRIRLEMTGHLVKNLKYNLTLSADKDDQRSSSTGRNGNSTFGVHYAYLDYKFVDAASLRFGQYKLPFSRVSLSSSSKQLLIERPASTESGKKLFGDYEQTELMLHGKVAGGIFNYMLAVADGADTNQAGTALTNPEGDPAYIGRLEFSPPGWIEKSKSDAHLGQGKHMTFGVHAGTQQGLKAFGSAASTDRNLQGADFSMHIGGFTAQAELMQWTVSQTALADVEPKGWYAQVGYLIPGVNIEPVARYEIYDHNSNTTTDREDKITTVGFNWYAKGHGLKIGANWVHTEFGTGNLSGSNPSTERDVYQIQTQLYF